MSTTKYIPILFKPEMVNAILEGRKTQTRRVVKSPQTLSVIDVFGKDETKTLCPYGNIGDVLWVRETWALRPGFSDWKYYKADYSAEDLSHIKWKPSIHMPKEACRLFLEVTEVRVQRLQDISANDAIDEGIEIVPSDMPVTYKNYEKGFEWDGLGDSTQSFQSLWESINGHDSWQANPFVWAITFKRIVKLANWPC
jgi:hypothetical protein